MGQAWRDDAYNPLAMTTLMSHCKRDVGLAGSHGIGQHGAAKPVDGIQDPAKHCRLLRAQPGWGGIGSLTGRQAPCDGPGDGGNWSGWSNPQAGVKRIRHCRKGFSDDRWSRCRQLHEAPRGP
jgi:hypothetical protein